jgi:hypothetical protein
MPNEMRQCKSKVSQLKEGVLDLFQADQAEALRQANFWIFHSCFVTGLAEHCQAAQFCPSCKPGGLTILSIIL